MNEYTYVILSALVLSSVLEFVSSLLNLRSFPSGVPKEFEGVYDAERYAQSQSYAACREKFGMVNELWGLALVLGFWFSGGFAVLDDYCRSLTAKYGYGEVRTGLLFIGALVLGKTILNLPFAWYSTFVIEERFGFNKMTRKLFVYDAVRGLLLTVVLGVPVLAVVLLFFQSTGDRAWLWCWGVVSAFTLILQVVAPAWIMPLFYKFKPLEDGELKTAIIDYARKVNFPLEKLFVIDGSKRSKKSNAFFSGIGRMKRLALFDTLIENQSKEEIVAVVAHEVGHYKRGHIPKMTIMSLLHSGLLFFLLSVFLREDALFDAFYVKQPSAHAALVFFGMLYAPIELLLSIGFNAFSRKFEFEADAYARESTGSPETMIAALKKLSADNLVNLTPHRLGVILHHSHPPMLERIEALRR